MYRLLAHLTCFSRQPPNVSTGWGRGAMYSEVLKRTSLNRSPVLAIRGSGPGPCMGGSGALYGGRAADPGQTDWETHTTENITFLQLLKRAVTMAQRHNRWTLRVYVMLRTSVDLKCHQCVEMKLPIPLHFTMMFRSDWKRLLPLGTSSCELY